MTDNDALKVLRERLPNRRSSENLSFELGGISYHATVGMYPDGRPGEIFISSHKAGSATDVAARDAAIAVSFALQFGAELSAIAHAMSRDRIGNASSPLGKILDILAEGDGKTSELRADTGSSSKHLENK